MQIEGEVEFGLGYNGYDIESEQFFVERVCGETFNAIHFRWSDWGNTVYLPGCILCGWDYIAGFELFP